jgi:Transposase DNA-binding/Transposase DDE domain
MSGLSAHSWFNDHRLSLRFGVIVAQIGNNFGSSLPKSGGNHGQAQAIYRFMNNEKVTDPLLYHSSGSLCKDLLSQSEGQTYLAVSDTTKLDYSTNKSADNLDCLDYPHQKGLFCQTLMLMDALGCPEGLLRQSFFNRSVATLGQSLAINSTARAKIPIEEKESYRWLADYKELETLFGQMPQHRIVHLIDSEGDIFELFAARQYEHIHILTRAHHDRKLFIDPVKTAKGEYQPSNLKMAVCETACQGCFSLLVKDDKTGEKRRAQLEVRWAKVTMDVPQTLKSYQKAKGFKPIPINVVEVREVTPEGSTEHPFKPLQWFLMTTLPVETLVQASEIIHFYTLRWRIEDFHMVLKEGCKIEELQFEEEHALKNAIVVYSIVAIQVLRLRYLSEHHPEKTLEEVGIPVKAYQAVATFIKKVKKINITIVDKPTIVQFCQLITLLGTGNKKNKGLRALWRGIREMNLLWEAFNVFNTT